MQAWEPMSCVVGFLLQALLSLAGLGGHPVLAALRCWDVSEPTDAGQVQDVQVQDVQVPDVLASDVQVLGASPVLIQGRPGEALQSSCGVHLRLAGAQLEHRVVCGLLLQDAEGQAYGPAHRLRVTAPDDAWVHLPGPCPVALAVHDAAELRLLEASAPQVRATDAAQRLCRSR